MAWDWEAFTDAELPALKPGESQANQDSWTEVTNQQASGPVQPILFNPKIIITKKKKNKPTFFFFFFFFGFLGLNLRHMEISARDRIRDAAANPQPQ